MNCKLSFLASALLIASSAFAQDAVKQVAADAAAALSEAPQEEIAPKPVYWKNSIKLALGLDMTSLSNWAAGGYNTAMLTSSLDAKADYAKNLMSWNNRLQLDYGFFYSQDKEGILQKSNDRIYLESKWAYKTGEGSFFNYTASFNFRSQFTDTPEGYAQNEEGTWHPTNTKSGFLSPAYTDIALGIQWAPTNWFNVNLAPLTGGLTVVTNPLLRKNYGMKLTKEDLDPAVGSNYNSVLFQFGAQLKTNFKLTFNDNFGYETQLVLFTDYLNEPYVRINWDNAITWKFTKYVNFAFKTWLISDPNVTRTLDDGTTAPLGVQFKSYVSFNFTYSFAK